MQVAEGKDITQLSQTGGKETNLADVTQPQRPPSSNKTGETSSGFLVLTLHHTCSRSFQRPFGHSINKQPQHQHHNTQRLEMGVRGRGERGEMVVADHSEHWGQPVCIERSRFQSRQKRRENFLLRGQMC